MSYTVLARKYRPQVFADMVGQEHLVKVLTHAIASGRVAHAYLFSGPRGVGKTTAARILAKALNCEQGPTPEPCGVCTACVEIRDGRSLDVLEIDGASNRGINEVRELRENVRFVPSGGRSKIYIIDEVHMLTQEAFNALLKTLEEPPAQVVFVFATTEPFKVPGTILSRCQRFDFARIPTRKIAEHLAAVLERENAELEKGRKARVEVSPSALALISRRAQGGLRDALSTLDQVLAAVEGPVDRETVESFLGLVGEDFYHALVERLAEGDAAAALTLLDTTYARGADLRDLAEGLAGFLRDLLLLRIDETLSSLVEAPDAETPRLKTLAHRFSRETLLDLVDRAAELAPALRRTEAPRLAAELALAEMTQMSRRVPLGDLAARLLELERRLGGVGTPAGPDPHVAPIPPSRAGRPSAPGRRPSSAPAAHEAVPAGEGPGEEGTTPDPASPEGLWALCLEAARATSIPLCSKLALGNALRLEPGRALVIHPATPAARGILRDCLAEPETQAFLRGVLEGRGLPGLRVEVEGEGPAAEPSASQPPTAIRDRHAAPEKPAEPDTRPMGQLFKEEPLLQKALDMFDGEVIP